MHTKKRIGVFTPIKATFASNAIVRELLPERTVEELYGLLDVNSGIEYYKDLDPHKSVIENGKVYCGDICVSDLDLFFWYYLPDYDPTSFEFQVLETVSRRTKVSPNPQGLVRSMDKFTAHSALKNAGLPTPDFALFPATDTAYAKKLFKKWGTLLLKPRLGKFGHGILKIDSEGMLRDAIAYAASSHPDPLQIFVERFEENDIDRWISATNIGGQTLFGYRKKSTKFVDGWKVYDEEFKGGEAFYVDPSPVENIASAAAKALGADIVGFDCIYVTSRKEYLIVDENTFPGIYEDCFEQAGKGSLAENFYRIITESLKVA
ncbi:MAG: hypothetical protein KBC74_02070 [Candidatus Pacebacteria bacterium]|nr:hypothetical protein [Candidatus Paceibacterota bacterium]